MDSYRENEIILKIPNEVSNLILDASTASKLASTTSLYIYIYIYAIAGRRS